MAALLFTALAASIAIAPPEPAAGATTSGAAGVFSLPTATWRGNFLLLDATGQRTGAALSGSFGIKGFVEAFGALSLRSTNLFSVASRRTLVSEGDADFGIKVLVPGDGPFSGGSPSAVAGLSMVFQLQ
jgi:hypothetical protein